MGRLNTSQEQRATLEWGLSFNQRELDIPNVVTLSQLQGAFDLELKRYFALACLSRSLTADHNMVVEAHRIVFRVRVTLESLLAVLAARSVAVCGDELLFAGSLFGRSKKQGTSLRMPLSSCLPTKLCSGACYAHDVLDAAPASVVRGVLNGVLAARYEDLPELAQGEMLERLRPHVRKAIRAAHSEVAALVGTGWMRRPYIRFSHVGEIAAFPKFANALATLVFEASGGEVDCVVYTRHPKAVQLDPTLWVINFTLDKSSLERRAWVPRQARVVFSAFGGELRPDVDVNFLEHHRWQHMPPIGKGRVCPATLPESAVRTCDAVRCSWCCVSLSRREVMVDECP